MKVNGSGDKPKSLIDLIQNDSQSEAVKVSTGNKPRAPGNNTETVADSDSERGFSVKLGLAKYLSEQLDPTRLNEERAAKLQDLKARIASGEYLNSIKSENLAEKIAEEIEIESMLFGKIGNAE